MKKLGESLDPALLERFRQRLAERRRDDVAEATEAPCATCNGARFVTLTRDIRSPLFGEPSPCPECSVGFTSEERLTRAGIPVEYAGITLESCRQRAWREAWEAVEAWDGRTNLVLAGMPGRGKTFLAVAALRREIEDRERIGRFAYVEQLLEEIRRRYGDGEGEDAQTYIDRLVAWPLLVLDDLAQERANPWVTERLVSLFERRRQEGHTTVITTNRMSIADIARHYSASPGRNRQESTIEGERLASRLGPGVFTWVPVLGVDMRQYAIGVSR